MILFSVMPKIVYILLSLFLPWWVAILPALFMIGGFIFGFTEGMEKVGSETDHLFVTGFTSLF